MTMRPPPDWAPGIAPASSAATAALVVGIISLCFWPAGPLALLCGLQGREDIRTRGMTGNGQAVAGMILGAITSAACVIAIGVFMMGLWR